MSCKGPSCCQGRRQCTDWWCQMTDEEFEKEMNRRRGDAFICAVGVLALALWIVGVIS